MTQHGVSACLGQEHLSSGTSGAELPVRLCCGAQHAKECRPGLAQQVGAGGLPWWAVTLIVLGACAVFAAAVVGANLIVRTYQRRILGSSPLLAPPRGRALAGGRSVVAWRKLLLNALAFPWRRPGPAQQQRGRAAGAAAAAHRRRRRRQRRR